MRNDKNIPEPSAEEVERYLSKLYKSLEFKNYVAQEKALEKLIKTFPDNTSLSDILLKASTLNDFYSTNILSVYSVAKHIHSLKIDGRLASGDLTVVDDIKRVVIKNKEKKFYSFATKYCCNHNPEAFPIYDSFVEKMLMYFKGRDKFSTFKKEDLKNYPKFKQILLDFQKHYQLEEFSLRQLDTYLWLAGKEYFPRGTKPKA